MAKVAYREANFNRSTLEIIETANKIISEYNALGYVLTLRQLYYRFVAGGHIANSDKEYKRIGQIVANARYAGYIDWSAIEDRTRNEHGNQHWSSPAAIIQACADSYQIDKWQGQKTRVFAWVEKEALAGIVGQVAEEEDCYWTACRGYMSASEMREAALRFCRFTRAGQGIILLHLGDHDPSGIDMTRDIDDRLSEFCRAHGQQPPFVRRIALNMDQVDEYGPPPNPAKLSDSRCTGYMDKYGDESWELDALPPTDLADLIRSSIQEYRDGEAWEQAKKREQRERQDLMLVHENWSDVSRWVADEYGKDHSTDEEDEGE